MKSDTLSLKTVINEVDSLKKTVIIQWNDWKKTKKDKVMLQVMLKNTINHL